MTYRTGYFTLAFASIFTCGLAIVATGSDPSDEQYQESLKAFADVNADDSMLPETIRTIRRRVPGDEHEAKLLASVANSKEYSATRRCVALIQLFQRCIVKGMSLGEAGRILDRPTWLSKNDATVVGAIFGNPPFELKPGQTLCHIAMRIPEPDGKSERSKRQSLYFQVEGELTDAELYSALMGRESRAASLKITELIFVSLAVDPYWSSKASDHN